MSKTAGAADAALFASLRAMIDDGGTPEFDPVRLSGQGRPGWTPARLSSALDALAGEGLLARAETLLCPVATCRRPISESDIAMNRCPNCTTDFRTLDDPEPTRRTVYRQAGPLSRDLQWAVVIHGMNTFGPWQEEFSWRLALKLRYSAPVLIYKYGLIRVSVLFRFRHRALVQALGDRLVKSVALAAATSRTRPPDVILHSFGTLLFAKLLDHPSFTALKFGRVILAGSIVRPDHVWSEHLKAGRIEAVLNHCGSRDHIVDLAAFAIPDSGPSGRVGIADPAVLNVCAEGYDHSIFFEQRGLDESLAKDGLWDRFLRVPLSALEAARMDAKAARRWRPLPAPLRRIVLSIATFAIGLVGWWAGWHLLATVCAFGR